MGSKNNLHQSYQDYQKFLDAGGRMGLQHDVVQEGTYAWNPFLIEYEPHDMVVIEQGEVGVMKAYAGLPTIDISEGEFKHGALVRPGHCGIWRFALGTKKYPLNPQCYQIVIVPTSIIALN